MEIREIALEYIAMQDFVKLPAGSFDRNRRWFPTPSEVRPCCRVIREPSLVYPYTLLSHCRGAPHLACKYGVKKDDILKEAKRIRHEQATEQTGIDSGRSPCPPLRPNGAKGGTV